MSLGPYTKFIMAALAAVLAGILPGLTTGEALGISGIVNVIILAIGSLQVLNAPNVAWWGYAKGIAAAISAAGVVFVSLYTDGLTGAEIVQIILALVVGLGGVVGLSNGTDPARETRAA